MNKEYMCYCGLYCENCATKVKVEPAAKTLYEEMKKAGFEDVIGFMQDGGVFWRFLKAMAEGGTCASCRKESGNRGCRVRNCAKEKGVEICALCESYPCDKFDGFFDGYPMLEGDNELLRNKGIAEWAELQEKRKAQGYTYCD